MIDSTNVLLRHHELTLVERILARLIRLEIVAPGTTVLDIADAYRHERPWLRFIEQRLVSRAAGLG